MSVFLSPSPEEAPDKAPTERRYRLFGIPEVGATIKIKAVDWGSYLDRQFPPGTSFPIVNGTIYGKVIEVTQDCVVLAMQVFEDGGVRGVLAIPWLTVTDWRLLEGKEE